MWIIGTVLATFCCVLGLAGSQTVKEVIAYGYCQPTGWCQGIWMVATERCNWLHIVSQVWYTIKMQLPNSYQVQSGFPSNYALCCFVGYCGYHGSLTCFGLVWQLMFVPLLLNLMSWFRLVTPYWYWDLCSCCRRGGCILLGIPRVLVQSHGHILLEKEEWNRLCNHFNSKK